MSDSNLNRKEFLQKSAKYGIFSYGISTVTTQDLISKVSDRKEVKNKKKVLVNVFHPNMNESRINKAMMEALKDQPSITVRNIYAEYGNLRFTDTISVEKEKDLLLSHDRIVFQHPIYWYNCPPLMKKWIEDVLLDDWAWGTNGKGLLGKEWLHAVSCAGDLNSYRPGDFNGYSLGEYLRSFQQTSVLCNMHFRPTFAIHHVYKISDKELKLATQRYLEYLKTENLNREFEV
jgi:glutathione-regulated potassium-efflux system ancillary protein KefG